LQVIVQYRAGSDFIKYKNWAPRKAYIGLMANNITLIRKVPAFSVMHFSYARSGYLTSLYANFNTARPHLRFLVCALLCIRIGLYLETNILNPQHYQWHAAAVFTLLRSNLLNYISEINNNHLRCASSDMLHAPPQARLTSSFATGLAY